jgi:mono/diheme cytochrome c family protein
MSLKRKIELIALLSMVPVCFLSASEANDPGWLRMVPMRDHAQKNPIRMRGSIVAQGHKTYQNHCAHCHGENAKGSSRAPSLVSNRVQYRATDGDLHWLLVNGNRERGMPPWSKLGEAQIWQVVSYLRTLRLQP